MQEQIISSLQNPLIKDVVKLQQKAQERRRQNLFVTEGVREVSMALQAGVKAKHILICKDFFNPQQDYPVLLDKYAQIVREVSASVYNKMAYRQNAEGIIVVAEKRDPLLDDLKLSSTPLLLVLESVEKPGNLGAILRTADAAAVDAVVICDPQTDIFNPNVIRSSLGCLFTNQLAVCSRENFLQWCSKRQISIMLASVQADKFYFHCDMTQGTALVFGTEAYGLSEWWYQQAHEKLKIPMMGKTDSLNVSASVAVMTFEAQRQRITGGQKKA